MCFMPCLSPLVSHISPTTAVSPLRLLSPVPALLHLGFSQSSQVFPRFSICFSYPSPSLKGAISYSLNSLHLSLHLLQLSLPCPPNASEIDSHPSPPPHRAQCGLPEVQLGLLPGAGGTQRLPRLVGLPQAIQMITSGLPVRAPAALKSGLIDEISTSDPTVSPDEAIAECGFALGERLQDVPWDNSRVLSSLKVPSPEEGLEACFASATERVRKAARGAEAPMVALEALRAATESGSFELGLRREADLFLQLAMGEQAAALQHAFFADRQMSKVEGLRAPPAQVESVVVVGGGTMGSGIAMSFANAGIPVTIVELSQQAMDRGMQLIEGYYRASQSKGKLSEAEANARVGLIRASTQYDVAAVREADLVPHTPNSPPCSLPPLAAMPFSASSGGSRTLRADAQVVEAAFEKMEVKKQVFAQLDALCKPSAILASNTSCAHARRLLRTFISRHLSSTPLPLFLSTAPHLHTSPHPGSHHIHTSTPLSIYASPALLP